MEAVCGVEDDLITRAKSGEEPAWAKLYGDHSERLVIWLGHLVHSDPATDAEDVAAEAWLIAARRIADFVGDRQDFAGWMFGIARNIARSRSRTGRHRDTTPMGPRILELTVGTAADHAPAIASFDLTRQLVARLPQRESEVVTCLDVVGLDVATTSRALEISATAVRVAHHRGLRRLRRLLTNVERRAFSAADVTLPAAEGM